MSKAVDEINSNLERIASSLEKIIEQQENVEIEFPPPQCPHCQKINPRILIGETEVKGPFAEYLLAASCLNCGKAFFAIPIAWMTVRGRQEAVKLMNQHLERVGINVGSRTGTS